MKSDAELSKTLGQHADTVRRICFLHLNNRNEVEDVFQEVFLKYALRDEPFESDEHEKAWLIRVSVNSCKDVLKSFWRKNVFSIEEADITGLTVSDEHSDVLDAVLRLKLPKYRDVIYLHFYEGYSAVEIASILRQKENTVYTWLARAKKQLEALLGGDSFE